MGYDAVSVSKWLWDMTLSVWVGVVGYDAVSVSKWLLDTTLCLWVGGCWI